tara:strand:- start:171 stop:479 length:309 start_codon:yes stop_codon:yes gene_type:complete
MYYYISILITLIIFIVIQFNEYKSSELKKKKYNLFNLTNIVLIFFIYILSTIILFFIFENKTTLNIEKKVINNIDKNIEINPAILRKIPDNIYTGFTPYSGE